MIKKVLTIKAIDSEVEHKINSVRILTLEYSREIGKNEFHVPKVARLIVDTNERTFQYLIATPIIYSDEKGNINIFSSYGIEKLTLKKKYFTEEEYMSAKARANFFKVKRKFHLENDEVVTFTKAKLILDLKKIMKIKLDAVKGGGF